uniref:NADH dehydrogenase [ubiquinone] 1 alpha subcomplex subunit 13 n=1 Tax=Laticauda laticaudata TaxID=8630 RepID=A0A8C5WP23_LATLA
MTTAVKQDMPLLGSYGPIDYKRRFFCFWNLCYFQVNWERRHLAFEDVEVRVAMMPLLMAEEDRRTLRLMRHNLDEKAKIMKDVSAWQVGESVYHTTRWVVPRADELYFLQPSKVQEDIFFGYTWST